MKSKFLSCLLFLSACTLSVSGHTNDSVAALDAGGIVLGKSDDIVMEREDLFISEEQIRVSYIFRNTSDKPINTRVAFPVPEFPEHPDGDMSIDTSSKNPLKFSVSVEGKQKAFETELKKADGNISITHHWLQTFPAKSTLAVSHTYKPAVGGEAGFYFGGEERAARIKQYCIEPNLIKWIDRQITDGYTAKLGPGFVHYVLKTGANWKGPIGQFRLTVKKQNANDKVSFCGTGVKKLDAKTFVMEKKQFTPTDNLYVMFLHTGENSE